MERKHIVSSWRLGIQHLVSWKPATYFFSHFIHYVDLISLKISRGTFSISGFLTGWPIITLTTVGARSGLFRTLPLVGIPDGEKIILIASNFGRSKHPSWYYNLLANPKARVAVDGKERNYLARQAMEEEYELYWHKAIHTNPGYIRYRERAGERRIPIVVLIPQYR
jgi:deazaflavin-dependent oxidoreductase (nitroreductase family)